MLTHLAARDQGVGSRGVRGGAAEATTGAVSLCGRGGGPGCPPEERDSPSTVFLTESPPPATAEGLTGFQAPPVPRNKHVNVAGFRDEESKLGSVSRQL